MKHAWLIIAHNEFGILQRLVSELDDETCDLFIHFDRKVRRLPEIRTEKSPLHILKNRVDVRWGSISQIRCELALFEAAAKVGRHDYYHVISGVTLPLKPLSEIEDFFEHAHRCSIFTGLCRDIPYQEKLKVRRYNFFLRNYTSKDPLLRTASQFLWRFAHAFQRVAHIETNRSKSFYKASNWVSLTENAVQYLLDRKQDICKTYRWSFCGDEYFVPSELMASPLHDKVRNSNKYLYREILRSTATSYQLSELPTLSRTGCLFARKFTER